MEVLTEKVSMDALLDKAKAGATRDLTKFLLNTIGQAGVEVSEEEASLIGNTLAEAAILREKSEYNQMVQQLVVEGYSYADAKAAADKAIVDEAMETAIVSGLSGGMSGLAATVYSRAVGKADAAQSAQEAATPENQTQQSTDTQGAENAAAQETAQVANALTDALGKPEENQQSAPSDLSNTVTSKLTPELKQALAEVRDPRGVTPDTAAAIVTNPEALQQLQNLTGYNFDWEIARLMDPSHPETWQQSTVPFAVLELDAIIGGRTTATMNREGADAFIADLGQAIADNSQQTVNSNQQTTSQAGSQEVSPEVTRAIQTVLGTNPVDTKTTQTYNGNNELQGGNNNAGTANDRAGSFGNPEARLAGVRQDNGETVAGRPEHGGVAANAGIVRVSDKLQEAQRQRGTPTYAVKDTTADPVSYEQALTAGRNSDPVNGWCVTPKSAQELRDGNVRTFMNENGTVGVGIAPDGDIVAVFKNKNGGPRKALDTMMPIALEQGGDRLDCYGDGLVDVYTRYGFEPVARVAFNEAFANDGWSPDKGAPYIYFMKHNGDSADTVVQKMGTYPECTKAQLDDLPTFGKNDYDKAMAYRDSLMAKASPQSTDTSAPSPVQRQSGSGISDTLGMQNAPSGDINQSKTFTNSGLNSADPEISAAYEQTMKEPFTVSN